MIRQRKQSLDKLGVTLMIMLCAIWGFQQVTIKLAIETIPPIWQAGIRSVLATGFVGLWLLFFQKQWVRGLFVPGFLAGTLFALEFGLLYFSLRYTDASRAALLLYTSPFVVAIGTHFFIAGERLSAFGWLGVLLAFIGTAVMMQAAFDAVQTNPKQLLGDLCALFAGIAWGVTTLVVRLSGLSVAPPSQTLFYQLAVSGIILCLIAWGMEATPARPTTAVVWAAMTFQVLIVAAFSYLAWFMLMTRYAVTKLSVFGFLTPLYGSLFGVIFLGEVISDYHWMALGLIISGILIVNLLGHAKSTNPLKLR